MDIVLDHTSATECVPGSPFHPYTKAMYVQVARHHKKILVPFPYHHCKIVASIPRFNRNVKTELLHLNYIVIMPVMSYHIILAREAYLRQVKYVSAGICVLPIYFSSVLSIFL